MDLQEVTLDREVAKERFIEYRAAVRERHDHEDELLARSFKLVAEGRPVISLPATLQAGGRDERGMPNLAVCRADARQCWLEQCTYGGAVRFVTKQAEDGRAANNVRDVRAFPAGTFDAIPLPEGSPSYMGDHSPVPGLRQEVRGQWQQKNVYAIVPIVPPALRPRSLAGYEILWEVDAWLVDPKPPVDPALLKHVAGDLYAVVAVWDLSPLEQLVIGTTRRSE